MLACAANEARPVNEVAAFRAAYGRTSRAPQRSRRMITDFAMQSAPATCDGAHRAAANAQVRGDIALGRVTLLEKPVDLSNNLNGVHFDGLFDWWRSQEMKCR